MTGHDIIVIGASAGGVEALRTLVGDLPADLPASIFVVMHIPAQSPSLLPAIISRSGPLPAIQPHDHQQIEPGKIYIAPPDCHLLVHRDHVRVVRGPKENRTRPAVDPLFRTAAHAYGPRVVGVVLTGSLDDGTAGLMTIKRCGGVSIAQDPREALYPSMPLSAIQNVEPDYVVPLAAMPPLLARLAGEPVEEGAFIVPENIEIENELVEAESAEIDVRNKIGAPSQYVCPECHGTLWEMHDGDILRFRCRVGHAFTAESMLAEHETSLETALWVAMRALEERVSLSLTLAERAKKRGLSHLANRFYDKAADTQRQVLVIRELLVKDSQENEQPNQPVA